MIYLLTAIGLTPGGSYSTHLHTNNTQNNTKKEYVYTEQNINNNKNT